MKKNDFYESSERKFGESAVSGKKRHGNALPKSKEGFYKQNTQQDSKRAKAMMSGTRSRVDVVNENVLGVTYRVNHISSSSSREVPVTNGKRRRGG